jgi:transcriptional regulator with XRE-family HTH domain
MSTIALEFEPMQRLDNEKMKTLRKGLGITQVEAAKRAGMSLARWNDIETSRRGGNLELDTITKIAAALECSDVRDLITPPDPKPRRRLK